MASSIELHGEDSVVLRVTHSNLKTFNADIRFSLQLTVEGVKDKLWKKCGTSVNSMHLELYDDARNDKIADLSDNSKPLGFYSPLNGFRLHVVDLDPTSISSGGWLEDTSLVEKYEISDEAYNKRQGIKYKEKITSHVHATEEAKISDTSMEELCANIKVGSRCEVEHGAKRGVVKFVGRAESLGHGFWVGVQYDEPLGKHDGMVKGVRYFQCPPNHGGIVRPDKVKVGDYPERDPFEEGEI
ncbi:ribosomal RNA methyltransferase Nop2 [Vigna unguiculata]|uniref:Ribosomal RNA methyltransferase Nop2 n=1 Tax=Vigna unguiculata TaxID=3917 RepID=A0A4D6LD70_VIGUN|nr:ribosomal RNA methyltransferase Nop2 [Vigna unguiculata]